jgi:hypothetical protein
MQGSNLRRLSRRFTALFTCSSVMPLTCIDALNGAIAGAAVRYASVGAGFLGRAGCGRARNGPRTGAENATDGGGGSGYADRPPGFSVLTCHFRKPARCRRHPRHRGLARRPGCRGLCTGRRRVQPVCSKAARAPEPHDDVGRGQRDPHCCAQAEQYFGRPPWRCHRRPEGLPDSAQARDTEGDHEDIEQGSALARRKRGGHGPLLCSRAELDGGGVHVGAFLWAADRIRYAGGGHGLRWPCPLPGAG